MAPESRARLGSVWNRKWHGELLTNQAGELPAGGEFAIENVSVGIDRKQVQARTFVNAIRVSDKRKPRGRRTPSHPLLRSSIALEKP
jgi:hypothetical protein